MTAIGFRAEPKAIQWSVVSGTKGEPLIIADGNLAAPKTYSEAAALSWYRNQVLLLVDQYQPISGAVRYAELVSRNNTASTQTRLRIEGVILEALDSKGIIHVVTGALNTLSASIGGSKQAKKYLAGNEFRGVNWSERSSNRKEAILAATAALEK